MAAPDLSVSTVRAFCPLPSIKIPAATALASARAAATNMAMRKPATNVAPVLDDYEGHEGEQPEC